MKKLLVMVIAAISLQVGFGTSAAFADGTANLKIRLSGNIVNDRYFLCLPNGCFNIRAAQAGKVFSFYNPVEVSNFYVLDLYNKFRLYPQKMPVSCKTTVKENQTMTITGHLRSNGKGMSISGLNCRVS